MATEQPLPFGILLKRDRRAAGLSQAELAERAGYSVVYLSMLERGARAPLPATAALLADALTLSPNEAAALAAAAARAHTDAAARTPRDASLPVGGFLGALPEGPLISREAELERLGAALADVGRGTGRLLLLSGEAGVGKTRLAQEVTLRARAAGFLIATGRCYEPQRVVGYYPFLEALQQLLAATPPARQADLLRRWPEVARLLPQRPAGPAGGTGDDPQRLFWQVTGCVRALAERRPVALLLDDLHWADEASLDLLQHLTRQTRTSRVLLVGTHRDDEARGHQALLSVVRDLVREGLVEQVTVARLPQSGTAAQAAALLGAEMSADAGAWLHQRTEGNPFFTREVVRALRDRGDLYLGNGQWEHSASVEIVVPESVGSVIGQRVAQLPDVTQEVLREASVLGQAFEFGIVLRMRDRDEAEVETALEHALTAGLVHETGGDGYTFHHVLIQQALYAGLTARRKRHLHLAAGEALERLPERERAQQWAAVLAWHFSSGGANDRAQPYTLQAGNQAEAVYAHDEAVRQYRVAVAQARRLGDGAREAEALERLGSLLNSLSRWGEAIPELERAVAIARAAGDLDRLATSTAELASVYYLARRREDGWRHLQALLATLSDGAATETVARDAVTAERTFAKLSPHAAASVNLSLLGYWGENAYGDVHDALAAAERIVRYARVAGDLRMEVCGHDARGSLLRELGREDESLAAFEGALPLAERAGDLGALPSLLGKIGYGYLQRGMFDRVADYYARGLEAAERLGHPFPLKCLLSSIGEQSFYAGDWTGARDYHERAAAAMGTSSETPESGPPEYMERIHLGIVALAEGQIAVATAALEEGILAASPQPRDPQGDPVPLTLAHEALAELDVLEGHPEAARGRIESVLESLEGMDRLRIKLLPLLAWAYADLGEEDRAAEIAERAVEWTGGRWRLYEVDTLRAKALVDIRSGRWQQAAEALDTVLELSCAMPYPYAEAKALYVYGRLHAARGEPGAAHESFQAALAICARLGERLYAAHIERALAEVLAGTTARLGGRV